MFEDLRPCLFAVFEEEGRVEGNATVDFGFCGGAVGEADLGFLLDGLRVRALDLDAGKCRAYFVGSAFAIDD